MGKNRLAFALIVIITIALSFLTLLTFQPTNAQTTPTSSIPEFTVKFVNASYTVTTNNSYTGQSQTRLVNNNSIELTVNNQPFNYSNNGLSYQIYFNVRIKPHFSTNWTEVYRLENLTSSPANANGIFPYAWYIYSPIQSNSTSTIINFEVAPTDIYQSTGYDIYGTPFCGIPIDSQLDFQVESLVGHNSTYWYIPNPFAQTYQSHSVWAIAYDSASGWSGTQTVIIGETSSSSPSKSPTIPELSWLIILLFLTATLFVAVKLRLRI